MTFISPEVCEIIRTVSLIFYIIAAFFIITTLLSYLFKSMINEGVFPDDWKKSKVAPIHKKGLKSLIKNYRPIITILAIFSKVFEKLVFNTLFSFFLQNKLFTPCRSGFIPGDSCVSQLLSITHEIYESFDCHTPIDMSGTFLDISKVFDKV